MQKLSLNNIDAKALIKNTLVIIFGTVLLAFGTGVFLVPFNLVTGGISGLSIILVNIIRIDILTVDVFVTILTWLLFFLGWIILGSEFTLKTLVSAIVYPIALSIFIKIFNAGVRCFGIVNPRRIIGQICSKSRFFIGIFVFC